MTIKRLAILRHADRWDIFSDHGKIGDYGDVDSASSVARHLCEKAARACHDVRLMARDERGELVEKDLAIFHLAR